MTTRKTIRTTVVSVLLASMIAVGCGGENPEKMLASAKDYIAKNDNKAAVIQLKNALQVDPGLAEARFLLGRTLFADGDAANAEVELRKALEYKYPADQVVPLLAQAMLVSGQSRKVIDEFADTQLGTPERQAELRTTLAKAYLLEGKVDVAQAALDAALSAVAEYGPALLVRARIIAGNQDLSGALALTNSALEKSPGLFEGWQLKGDILFAQGNTKDALPAYRKALEIKHDYLPAHFALMSAAIQEDNLEEAGRQLDSVKKIAPNNPQTVYMQAQLSFRKKDFKAAQETIQQFLKALPDNALGLQLAGAIEYELKAYPMAESYLLKALPNTPELGLSRRMLISCYLRLGQPAKALAILQPVLEKIGEDSNMLALAGEVFMQNGDADKAESYFAKAAALDPKNAGKQTSLALSHLQKGETEIAYRQLEQIASTDTGITADLALIASQLKARQYDKALKSIDSLEKKQPDNPLAQNLRATAMLGKGDVTAARKCLEKALSINPAYFPAAASLANLDLADKKPAEAERRFEGVLATEPKNVQAMLALAELKARAGGKPDEVLALINKAVTANPTEISPRVALIGFHLGAKQTKQALSAAQDALAVLPDRPEILDMAGRAQQASEELNQALATYGKLAALMPGVPYPYLRMAEIQVAAKNRDAAMESLRKALAVKPDSIEAQRGMAMLHLEAGRTEEALTTARKIQKQWPKEAVGYVLEGDAYALKKSWSDAVSAYRGGLKQTGATELAVKLHSALVASGSRSEADKFSDVWLKDHAKDLRFRLYLAEEAGARKDFAAASRHYRSLLDAQPNDPAMMNNLAWALWQIKDPKAIEYAEKAYKLAPDHPAVMDTLAMLLVDKGEKARGVELLKKAVELAPQDAQIRLDFAKALMAAGKKEEARNELDQLVKLGDKYPQQVEAAQLLKGL